MPDAFAHPAKFSCGLIRRIFKHGLERGWWAKGGLIGDPFAGVGCGGLIAAGAGLRWFGVELEPRFVDLALDNFWARRHQHDADPAIIQGDSRRFAELVAGCDAIVTSPPWAESLAKDSKTFTPYTGVGHYEYSKECADRRKQGYGHTAGQIGAMPAGKLDAVVTSPPYAESVKGAHGETETAAESRDKRQTEGGSLGQSQRHGGYGVSAGNIGNLKEGKLDAVVTSPPYAETATAKNSTGIDRRKQWETYRSQGGGSTYKAFAAQQEKHSGDYGSTPGQIGQENSDTYWQAVAQVYEQCRLALKPGGVLVVVVADYVKAGRKVPLCDQTLDLLRRIGFEPVERIRAMMVKVKREAGLWEEHVTKTERKSFFRRLAERKGSPPKDWEEVLCVRNGSAGC